MKILMIMPVSIGDIVLTTPAIEAIKLKYPQSELHYAVQKGPYAEVLENNPHIVKLILLNGDYLSEIKKGNYQGKLREEIGDHDGYDLVIHFRDSDGHVRQQNLKNKHVAYYFAKRAGVKLNSIQPRLYVDAKHADEADAMVGKLQLTKDTKIIVLAPYSGFSREKGSKRTWSIDNFIFLMNEIGKTHAAKFVIVGAKNDPPVEHDQTINLMGYHLMTVAAIISKSDLFIGLDSGVAHIASAFDVPIINIMPTELPELWQPTNSRHVVFASRRKIRNYTSSEDLKKERVLKYCQLFLADPPLGGKTIIRFYPKITDLISRIMATWF